MAPRIAPAWLEAPATRAVLAALAAARPLFVGGCVRDALLGREAADLDLCVACPPETTVALLQAADLGAVPTGMAHGTITAVAFGRGFEVTTLRRDVATDGRHAVVAFTADVAQDAARRDFTMNALYADADGAVLDPLDGAGDVAAGRVRFIGEPAARITEDRLRVLRFYRFTAWFSRTGVDGVGQAACADAAGALGALSRERIGHEMKRLLAAPNPTEALAAMQAAGVLAAVAPGADAAALPALIAAETVWGAAPAWPRRAAAIGADGAVWRLSRADAQRVAAIAAARACGEPPAARAHRFGADAARDACLLDGVADATLEPELARGAAATFPLAARDLIAAGMAEGPALGAALARLREAWIARDFRPDRAKLLAML